VDSNSVLFSALDVFSGRKTTQLQSDIAEKINQLIELGKRMVFLSKSTSYSRNAFADKLRHQGVDITDGDSVATVGHTCGLYLRRLGVRKPFVVTSQPGLLEDLRSAGVSEYIATIDDEGNRKAEFKQSARAQAVNDFIRGNSDVDGVVLSTDDDLTAFKLAVAVGFLEGFSSAAECEERVKLPLLSCCPPSMQRKLMAMARFAPLPGVREHFESEGAFGMDVRLPSAAWVEACLSAPPEVGGFGIKVLQAVMISDNLETDMVLAKESGMKCLLVINSVTTKLDERFEIVPTWVLPSVADL